MSGLDNVRYTRARAGFLYWIVYLNRALELRPVGRPNSRFIPRCLLSAILSWISAFLVTTTWPGSFLRISSVEASMPCMFLCHGDSNL